MKNLIRWTRMQKGALIARNTKRKKAGKDKNRFLSSTLSTQHELIKHECKVFPPSLIIIALLVHLRIQLNLILEKSYANNFLQSTHTWLWYNFAQYTYPTPLDRLEFLSMISRTSLTWKLKRKKRKIFVRSNRNRRTWTKVAYTDIFYMYTTGWTASWGCSQDDHITHLYIFTHPTYTECWDNTSHYITRNWRQRIMYCNRKQMYLNNMQSKCVKECIMKQDCNYSRTCMKKQLEVWNHNACRCHKMWK